MSTPPIERKLAAILSADVAGYSRLMGADETGTLATLSAHREVIDELIRQRNGRIASTAGDSMVFFRHSEVISAGNIYSTVSYPMIDLANGGSIQGVIKGLNQILDLAVAEIRGQGGTWVIPSHGRLSDTGDVASYRNTMTMIRDRVQDLIDKGRTLEQVKAAKPTMDFDGRYGADTGPWTTAMFVEAVYKSLKEKK